MAMFERNRHERGRHCLRILTGVAILIAVLMTGLATATHADAAPPRAVAADHSATPHAEIGAGACPVATERCHSPALLGRAVLAPLIFPGDAEPISQAPFGADLFVPEPDSPVPIRRAGQTDESL